MVRAAEHALWSVRVACTKRKDKIMIELTAEYGYVVGSTDAWLNDITDQSSETAQEAFGAWRDASPGEPYYETDAIYAWLATLHDGTCWQDDETGDWSGLHGVRPPTGLYHDGKPFTAATINEENWLNRDIMVTLAHTAEYGDLLFWQYGYCTTAAVHVRPFTGDDDADAYSWAGGAAGHADGSECEAEWIIESAVELWPNGGRYESHRISDLTEGTDSNGSYALMCPMHPGSALAFMGY